MLSLFLILSQQTPSDASPSVTDIISPYTPNAERDQLLRKLITNDFGVMDPQKYVKINQINIFDQINPIGLPSDLAYHKVFRDNQRNNVEWHVLAPNVTIVGGTLNFGRKAAELRLSTNSWNKAFTPNFSNSVRSYPSLLNVNAEYFVSISVPFLKQGQQIHQAAKQVTPNHLVVWIGKDAKDGPKNVTVSTGVKYCTCEFYYTHCLHMYYSFLHIFYKKDQKAKYA